MIMYWKLWVKEKLRLIKDLSKSCNLKCSGSSRVFQSPEFLFFGLPLTLEEQNFGRTKNDKNALAEKTETT